MTIRIRRSTPYQLSSAFLREYGRADLLRELVRHDHLRVVHVQVGQVHQHLSHALIQHDRVALLHELSDDLPFIIFDNQNLVQSAKKLYRR